MKCSARRRCSVLLVWFYGSMGRLWHGSAVYCLSASVPCGKLSVPPKAPEPPKTFPGVGVAAADATWADAGECKLT